MSWITFSLLAAVVWSVVNVIDKYVMSGLNVKPVVPIIFSGIISVIMAAAVYLFIGFGEMSLLNITLALLAGVIFMGMPYFYFKAVQIEEISRVVPLFYLSPIFISVIAWFTLGELFTPLKYLGILLLTAGALVLSMRGKFSLSLGKAFWLMIISCLFLSVEQVLAKYLLGFADYWTVFAWIRLGSFLAVVPLLFMGINALKEAYKRNGMHAYLMVTTSEVLTLGGNLSITVAASICFVTLVNALSSVQPFFTLLLATLLSIHKPHVLKEELGGSAIPLKIAAIALMFVGAVIIS